MRHAVKRKGFPSARGAAATPEPSGTGAGDSGGLHAAPCVDPAHPPSSLQSKPRVLFIVDAPNWAHDFKTQNLMNALGGDYCIRKSYQAEVTPADLDSAELIVLYYWRQLGGMPAVGEALERNRRKLLMGICSNYEMQGEWRDEALAAFSRFARALFVNNLAQYKEFQRLAEVPVFYTPNGVDTEFYRPAPERNRDGALRVGWAGSLTNHGNKRGFEEFILPGARAVEGVELAVAAREEKWRTPEEMRAFYRSLDAYICASSEEGTPNPCLEAAACGVPLLTTRVGNMPELVRHGVNGLFIERDVDDIAEKLALLLHNSFLREEMGRRMLESIRVWDWRAMAENYRTLFDTVLRMNGHGNSGAQLFSASSDLYLASTDRMDRVLENIAAVSELKTPAVDTYATVIGGMSGLNYLLKVKSAEVVFYDVNASAVEYGRMIVELIRQCQGPREFIGRVFGRSVENFLEQTGCADLTVENQAQYLAMPVDDCFVASTLQMLSPSAARTYEECVVPHHAGRTLEGARNCRRLLPCWPQGERVPVGAGETTGDDGTGTGRRLPNTNTFFYGQGWLGSEDSFRRVKDALEHARLRFAPMDLFKQELRCLGDPSGKVLLHVSNIDDWFPADWKRRLADWQAQCLRAGGELTVITSHNGLQRIAADPHLRAYHAVAPFVFGNVVEVTRKVPWGFHEFAPTNVQVDRYLEGRYPADTTILHILVGEGASRETLLKAYRKALASSRRVIVLEHNRVSTDWTESMSKNFFAPGELRETLNSAAGELPAMLTDLRVIPGETDGARNMAAVIDTAGPVADMSPEAAETIQRAVEAERRRDLPAALEGYLKAMALAPATPGLAEAVQRVKELTSARPAAVGEPGGAASPREQPAISPRSLHGQPISFCLITNGARPGHLRMAIESIRSQRVPDCEIIVVGKHHDEPGILYVPAEEAALAGKLGVLRNLAVDRARHELVVIMDDDILLSKSWYREFLAFEAGCDVMTSCILLPDGTRYWDYATSGGERGHRLLRHDEGPDDHVYMSGGCAWVISAAAARRVRWQEDLGFYQGEDVRFAQACRQQGLRVCHNPRATAWHDAPAYTRVGRSIFRRHNGMSHLWVLCAPEVLDPEELLALAAINSAEGRTPERADCLRVGMELYPADPRFLERWAELQNANGGDAGGDQWHFGGHPDYRSLAATFFPGATSVKPSPFSPRIAEAGKTPERGGIPRSLPGGGILSSWRKACARLLTLS